MLCFYETFLVKYVLAVTQTAPDNTQHSQETDIHAAGGIRTSNPIKQAAADGWMDGRTDGRVGGSIDR